MLTVGLTGGIGSGKSAAANHFSALGIPVIDADKSARSVVEKGTIGLARITDRFGKEVLTTEGELNRQALRNVVFTDTDARNDLESILHPLIQKHMWDQLSGLKSPYAILDIPLLFETGQNELVDRVLVIDCPTDIQIDRICQRDGISPEEAQSIINSQIPRTDRLSKADDIVDNSGSLDKLIEQVNELHIKYLQLANTQKR